MRKRIWIPRWLYKVLPVAAVLIGAMGVLLSCGHFGWLLLSMLTFGYGAVVTAARWCASDLVEMETAGKCGNIRRP